MRKGRSIFFFVLAVLVILCSDKKTFAAEGKSVLRVTNSELGRSAEYESFEDAMSEMGQDFEKKKGVYYFYLMTDCTLGGNVTLPDFVTEAHFQDYRTVWSPDVMSKDVKGTDATGKGNAENGSVAVEIRGSDSDEAEGQPHVYRTIDLKGHSLSAQKICVWEGVRFANSAAYKGIISVRGTDGEGLKNAAMRLYGFAPDDTYCDRNGKIVRNGDNAGHQELWIDQVEIRVPKGTFYLCAQTKGAYYTINGNVTAKSFCVESGKWKLGDVAVEAGYADVRDSLQVNKMTVAGGKEGTLNSYITGTLLCDELTMGSKGCALVMTGGKLIVNENAVLYRLTVDRESADPAIYYTGRAKLGINGKMTRKSSAVLQMGLLDIAGQGKAVMDEKGEIALPLANIKPGTSVFTTDIKDFPLAAVRLLGNGANVFISLYQNGNEIQAVSCAVVLEKQQRGAWELCGSFITLQEAFKEIDALADKQMTYRVLMTNDTEGVVTSSEKPLTFPSKAAHVIVRGSGENDTAQRLYYNNKSLALTTDLTLQSVIFEPSFASSKIALGGYALVLENCSVAKGKSIGSLTGSAGKAYLALRNSGGIGGETANFVVSGKVNNIAELELTNANLTVGGAVKISKLKTGIVDGQEGEGVLTTAVTVKRDDFGDIVKVTPKVTITGGIEGNLKLELAEKYGDDYRVIDFDKDLSADMSKTGIRMAKATAVPSTTIKLSEKNNGTRGALVKKSGYLVYTTAACGYRLNYREDFAERVTDCVSFKDAVTEIKNLKTKRDYVIEVLENELTAADRTPAALTMPGKASILSLTITGSPSQERVIPYTGNLKLTSDTVLQNVRFKHYSGDDAKQQNVKINGNGNSLTIKGKVVFDTPVILNGGNKKSALSIEDMGQVKGQLFAASNNYDTDVSNEQSGVAVSVVMGDVKNFATVKIASDQILRVEGTASFKVTRLENEGKLIVGGDSALKPAVMTVKNLFNSGVITVNGNAKLKNVTMTGDTPSIYSDRAFRITGWLNCNANKALLTTRRKGSGKMPYLNISGEVSLGGGSKPIEVKVMSAREELYASPDAEVGLRGAPGQAAQLLTAEKAAADVFVPTAGNVTVSGETSPRQPFDPQRAPDGYKLVKKGTGIYVCYGDEDEASVLF